MIQKITGIHHVTALASDAQKNLDFYAGILGLRMVKKTINFDAPDVYHLYYGNENGDPGTIMTFFPFPGIRPGRKGTGQLSVTSFSIPMDSLDYWIERLKTFKISTTTPTQRFDDELVVYFQDFDGLGLELVANQKDKRNGFSYGQIPVAHAIKGFYGVTLMQDSHQRTAAMLNQLLDHQPIAEKGNRFRFSPSGKPGDLVDILQVPGGERGLGGGGTVHHLAFATANGDTQLEVRDRLTDNGVDVTQVLDRQYFHSIYFREPRGVLFEVATNPPGFAIDEPLEHLGEAIKLPPWQESNRINIEAGLVDITLNADKFRD